MPCCLCLALLAAASVEARLVVSVSVGTDTTHARVVEGSSGVVLGSSSAASQSGASWWTAIGEALSGALTKAERSHLDVSSIEFHPRSPEMPAEPLVTARSGRPIIIEPSVLAADIGSLSAAAREVAAAGATWVHVDITDGSLEAGRSFSSLGPASVAAVRAAAPALLIDVHLYTLNPEAHVVTVAEAGADRITFQMETLGAVESIEAQQRAKALAATISAAGCRVGVCIAPETPVGAVESLCRDRLVDLVDVLTVNPGIGGQKIQLGVLEKVRALRAAHPSLPYLLVDGGIDDATAPLAAEAGANALVSGSYLFRAPPGGMGERLHLLERVLVEKGD